MTRPSMPRWRASRSGEVMLTAKRTDGTSVVKPFPTSTQKPNEAWSA